MTDSRHRRRARLAGLLPLLALLAGLGAPAWADHSATEPSDGTVASFIFVKPPRQVPPFAIQNAQGQRISLKDLEGRVVLLNIWATWCPPCVREMPALDRLQAKLGSEDFTVVALSIDEGGLSQVAPFYRRFGINALDIYLDLERTTGAVFPVDVLPANFLIDRQGRVLAYLRSFADWDAPEAEALIRHLIEITRNQPQG